MRNLLRLITPLFLLLLLFSSVYGDPHSLSGSPDPNWAQNLRYKNIPQDAWAFLIVMSGFSICMGGLILASSHLAEERKSWRRVANSMMAGPPILFIVWLIAATINTIITLQRP